MRNRFLRGLIPALVLAAMPGLSSAGFFVGVSVNIAPPPLPVYVQPACPEAGYIWVPGYWGWNDGAYYWVPGTWVLPPEVGLLWTPGYWGWADDDDAYEWHAGYWGPHVGFYGGIDYGYGYGGVGFDGGYWRGGIFFYNRAVMHVGPTIVNNVYYHQVVYNNTYEHVSYNGGRGGVMARPSRGQLMAQHEHHFEPTPVQQRQQHMAFADRALRADYNHGRPPIAATARPAVFHGHGVLAARAAGGPMHLAPNRDMTPARGAAPMRSASSRAEPMRGDRPPWATGQSRSGRAMEHGPNSGGQASRSAFERPQQQRFDRPQGNYEQHGGRPLIDRPPSRPQPGYHQELSPQSRAESSRDFRPPSRPQPDYRQQEYRPQRPPEFHQEYRAPQQPEHRQEYRQSPPPEYRQEFRAQPQYRQEFRPPESGPRMSAPEMRGPPPREQRGGERPPPNHPPENRGGHGRW